ncbi:MAG: malonyl CoA-ACP transacylase, partial [Chitinivibrionales bacterium]|nr:malonyl CoA-ACP transacylase [Chitinivibrionales bacterium]MBD3356795.1 malonyl CoA-ACP transacylase [Chitinivibrionales bacterium]
AESYAERILALTDGIEPKETVPTSNPPNVRIVAPRRAPNEVTEDIAIIGMSGRYPQAPDLDRFWNNLLSGKESVAEIPKERWDSEPLYDPDPVNAAFGKIYSKWGGFLDDVDEFDAPFFGVTPAEAKTMDPHLRLFLETAWNTFEDAGYKIQKAGTSPAMNTEKSVGVFVGVCGSTYPYHSIELLRSNRPNGRFPLVSTPQSAIANYLSFLLDLTGPSLTIDSMCSSSMAALHYAMESIKRGECTSALAGGVNLYFHPYKYLEMCKKRMLSVDGKTRSFGKGGTGFVPGEGVGAVLLKPLSKAVHDHDRIHAVIKGSHLSHSGKTSRFGFPKPQAHAALIHDTLAKIDMRPDALHYLEMPISGSELSDELEMEAVREVFADISLPPKSIAVGALKPNIGHGEAVSGVAQLIKVILQMKHRTIAPTVISGSINPKFDLGQSIVYIPTQSTSWNMDQPLTAGVFSYGAGGTGVMAVVQEYRASRPTDGFNDNTPYLFVLSARTTDQLKEYADRLRKWSALNRVASANGNAASLRNIAFTLQTGRAEMVERLAIEAKEARDLINKLSSFIEGGDLWSGVYIGRVEKGAGGSRRYYKKHDDEAFFTGNVAKHWVSGGSVDWSSLYDEPKPYKTSLPTYPFEKKRYRYRDSIESPKERVFSDRKDQPKAPEIDWMKENGILILDPTGN